MSTQIEDLGGEWAPVTRVTRDDGSTVVVKRRRTGGTGWGYDPVNLRTEAAVCRLAAELDLDFVPHLVAYDDAAGVLVMTDLGSGPTVQDVGDGDDAEAATAALVAHGRALGRLGAATAGVALGGADGLQEAFGHPSAELWSITHRDVERHALPQIDPAVDGDVDQLMRRLRSPGGWRAITHNDAIPRNGIVLADGRIGLVDFESAGVRHVGLDAAYLAFPFPNSPWVGMPHATHEAMEAAYRQALVSGVPRAADDAAYAEAIAIGCAAYGVLRSARLDRVAKDGDESHRRRAQQGHLYRTCVTSLDAARVLPHLTRWFEAMAVELERRWPESAEPPPPFPAYQRR